jgi:hypothetical protein
MILEKPHFIHETVMVYSSGDTTVEKGAVPCQKSFP